MQKFRYLVIISLAFVFFVASIVLAEDVARDIIDIEKAENKDEINKDEDVNIDEEPDYLDEESLVNLPESESDEGISVNEDQSEGLDIVMLNDK